VVSTLVFLPVMGINFPPVVRHIGKLFTIMEYLPPEDILISLGR
jgi:hypothetical protein